MSEYTYYTSFFERTCPVCGKRFIIQDIQSYAYKTAKGCAGGGTTKLLCSWTCLNRYRDQIEAERAARRKAKKKRRKKDDE